MQLLHDLAEVNAALPSPPLRHGQLHGHYVAYPQSLAHTGQLTHWTAGSESERCESTLELELAQELWWMSFERQYWYAVTLELLRKTRPLPPIL